MLQHDIFQLHVMGAYRFGGCIREVPQCPQTVLYESLALVSKVHGQGLHAAYTWPHTQAVQDLQSSFKAAFSLNEIHNYKRGQISSLHLKLSVGEGLVATHQLQQWLACCWHTQRGP